MIEFEVVEEEPDEATKALFFLWENQLVAIGELRFVRVKDRADLDLAVSLGIKPSRIRMPGEYNLPEGK